MIPCKSKLINQETKYDKTHQSQTLEHPLYEVYPHRGRLSHKEAFLPPKGNSGHSRGIPVLYYNGSYNYRNLLSNMNYSNLAKQDKAIADDVLKVSCKCCGREIDADYSRFEIGGRTYCPKCHYGYCADDLEKALVAENIKERSFMTLAHAININDGELK